MPNDPRQHIGGVPSPPPTQDVPSLHGGQDIHEQHGLVQWKGQGMHVRICFYGSFISWSPVLSCSMLFSGCSSGIPGTRYELARALCFLEGLIWREKENDFILLARSPCCVRLFQWDCASCVADAARPVRQSKRCKRGAGGSGYQVEVMSVPPTQLSTEQKRLQTWSWW